jgi:ABC-type glucose/galactose transport system permease subunit
MASSVVVYTSINVVFSVMSGLVSASLSATKLIFTSCALPVVFGGAIMSDVLGIEFGVVEFKKKEGERSPVNQGI